MFYPFTLNRGLGYNCYNIINIIYRFTYLSYKRISHPYFSFIKPYNITLMTQISC